MFKLWPTKKEAGETNPTELTWTSQATQGLEQALAQAPVPAMLRGRVRSELVNAAETHARAAGRNEVTPQDLMEGMLRKLPANMRSQVEEAMKKGPAGLKDLEQHLKR